MGEKNVTVKDGTLEFLWAESPSGIG